MTKVRGYLRRTVRLVAAGLITVGATLGFTFMSAPSAMAFSGDCVLRDLNDPTMYAGDYQLIVVGVFGGSTICNVSAGDAVTFNIPAGLRNAGGNFPSSYNNGLWTCSWNPTTDSQTATCTANVAISAAPGQVSGMFLPVAALADTAPGAYDVTATGAGQTVTSTVTVSRCEAPIPLIDPAVAAGAIGVAGVAGVGLLFLRRHKRGRAKVTS